MLTKRIGKMFDGYHTSMLRGILNESWKQHPSKQQVYGPLPSITKIIKIRRTRHAGHCWRSKDEHISDILLWTTSHRSAIVGRLTRTYLRQLCTDTGCCLEDLPETMDYRDEWREIKSESGRSVLAALHDDDDEVI